MVQLLKRHPISLSILFHVLLMLYLFYFSFNKNTYEREIQPEMYVPAYFATAPTERPTQVADMANPYTETLKKNLLKLSGEIRNLDLQPVADEGIAFNVPKAADAFAAQKLAAKQPKEDPLHLIGEKLMEDPLRRLLGVALTKHLLYPRLARDLQLRGIVSVELMLHPNGQITHIRLLQSSRENMLDVAALNAIHDMSPVHNVDVYLKEARYMVFNIIFN